MSEKHLVIVGGGLAGLAAGCYGRASGYRTTIIEHNLALGGVCTAWTRGAYTIDGCIHWLTGGAFTELYEELGIVPDVILRTLDTWVTYRDLRERIEIPVTRDLEALARTLAEIAPEDSAEIRRIVDAARHVADLSPSVNRPQELSTVRDSLGALWGMRHEAGTLFHFRKPFGVWSREHLHSPRLRRFVSRLVPGEDAPALLLPMLLGYLERGWLSRPIGGTTSFRDALIHSFYKLGGEARLHATVDEVLVTGDRVRGVRLADGSIVDADRVISTASMPETVLRLLGGRYGADETRKRLQDWKLFEPIVLASFGASIPCEGSPPMLLVDGIAPFDVGGKTNDHLYVRVCNDDPSFAPKGHSVVQAMMTTDYEWWATRGTRYATAKETVGELALEMLSPHFPGLRGAVHAVDVATPLTYWSMARSWRGAYEGWMPNGEAFFGHVKKTLPGLAGFSMAGQWVEPGGGVPTAIMSGRQAIQLACAEDEMTFVPSFGIRALR